MNGADLHLTINHIPVIMMPLCFLVLLAGMLRKSHDLIQAGLVGLILTAIITVPVLKTGGPAAHTLFKYPGVSVERSTIHEHAEAATLAGRSSFVLGVLALIAWWFSRRPQGAPTFLVALITLGALAISVGFARVAHLGGEIRHPEIEASAPAGAMMMAPAGQH
jgi:hypothetical protein